jgi:hypothetical protein
MYEPVLDKKTVTGPVLSCYGTGAPGALVEPPFFSWKTYGFNGKQAAYHIIAASSKESALAVKGDVWDSRWVESLEDQRVP